MKKIKDLKIRNVRQEVAYAISQYCKEKGITQANYLENDKRIKAFVS